MSGITFDWRQGTTTASQTRWGIFNTSIDGGPGGSIRWSMENPPVRPNWENVSVDLSGAAYQGLSNTTVTFYWYTENTGSDLDTIVLSGSVREGCKTGDTRSLVEFLEAEGHTVTREKRSDGPGDVSAFDLVIVSRDTSSPDYDEGSEIVDWNGLSLPMINMAPHLMRNNRWGWVNGSSLPTMTFSSYDSPFADPTHPIVQSATVSMFDSGLPATGVSNALPAGSVQVATMGGGASHGIFVIPAGTTLFNGAGTAGNVRIGFICGNSDA